MKACSFCSLCWNDIAGRLCDAARVIACGPLFHSGSLDLLLRCSRFEAVQDETNAKQKQEGDDVNGPTREGVEKSVSNLRSVIVRQDAGAAHVSRVGQNRNRNRGKHENRRSPETVA